ncbi:hypothetical protein DMA11_20790 [Marinilabiliaceae bacterium JC017]|nr:hypothetical protein DMA11_20790 [Marinilabiliaceae bacterium JC017]
MKYTNALHGNIPDYGPYNTVNNPVRDRLHLHFESGRLTPGSKAAGSMTPTRSRGLAMTSDGLPLKYDTLHPSSNQWTKTDADLWSRNDYLHKRNKNHLSP